MNKLEPNFRVKPDRCSQCGRYKWDMMTATFGNKMSTWARCCNCGFRTESVIMDVIPVEVKDDKQVERTI
jgi:C4-type Zn-finger protein